MEYLQNKIADKTAINIIESMLHRFAAHMVSRSKDVLVSW